MRPTALPSTVLRRTVACVARRLATRCTGRRFGSVAVSVSALLALCWAPPVSANLRQDEIQSCRPGELQTWPDGQDRPAASTALHLVYRPIGAPAGLDEPSVLRALQLALAAWSACGVPGTVLSETAAATHDARSLVRVQWSEAESRGNAGLSHLGQRTLTLGPAVFQLIASRRGRALALDTLQMTLSHEIGHFYGLMAHSRRCVDVMSYYDNGRGAQCSTRDGSSYRTLPEYRASLPTACDIARCRALNSH